MQTQVRGKMWPEAPGTFRNALKTKSKEVQGYEWTGYKCSQTHMRQIESKNEL